MNFVPIVEEAIVGPPDWFLSNALSVNKWLPVNGGGCVLLAFSSKPYIHVFTLSFDSTETVEASKVSYVGQLQAHHERICGVTFCDSANCDLICVNLFTCGNDGLVRRWRYMNAEWLLEDEYNVREIHESILPTTVSSKHIEGRCTVLIGTDKGNLILWLSPKQGNKSTVISKKFESEGVLCCSWDSRTFSDGSLRFAVGYKRGIVGVYAYQPSSFNLSSAVVQNSRFFAHEKDVCHVIWRPSEGLVDEPSPSPELLTTGRDQFVKLWTVSNSWCCASVKVPGNPRSFAKETDRSGDSKKQSVGAPWISATWLPTENTLNALNVCVSGLRGELYSWSGSGQLARLLTSTDSTHSSLVFSMVRVAGSPGLFFSAGQDRQVILWQKGEGDTVSRVFRLPTVAAAVFAMTQSDHGLGPVAVGVADGSITLWRHGRATLSSLSGSPSVDSTVTIYPRGSNASGVTALAWHPSRKNETLLAYGTEAGCVEVVDTAKVSKSNIQKGKSQPYILGSTVYRVAWGPLIFDNLCSNSDHCTSLVNSEEQQCDESSTSANCSNPRPNRFHFYVYSVCKGKVFLHMSLQRPPHDVTSLFPESPDITPDGQVVDKRSDISFLLLDERQSDSFGDSTLTMVSATYDCLVALGLRSGLVYLYGHTRLTGSGADERSPYLQSICRINSHTKGINCMAWSPLYCWLAVGSNEHFITVTDFSDTLRQAAKCDSPHFHHLTTSLAHLEGHCNRITCLDWSPHDPHLLLSASYDGTANVWRIDHKENAASVANFRASRLRLFACLWSRHEIDLAFTGGELCHLLSWRPSRLAQKEPPNTRRFRPPPLKRLPVESRTNSVPDPENEETVTETTVVSEGSTLSASICAGIENTLNLSVTEVKPISTKKQTTSSERHKRPTLFPNFLRRDSVSHSSVNLNFIPPFQLGSRFMQVLHILYWLNSGTPIPDVDSDLLFLLPYHMQARHSLVRFLTGEADRHFIAYKSGQRPNSLNHLDAYCMIQLWLGRAPLVSSVLSAEGHMPFWMLWAVQLALGTPFGTCSSDTDLLEAKVKEITNANISDTLLASTLLICGGRSSAAVNYLFKHDRVKEALILAQLRLNPTDSGPVIKQCLMRIIERRLTPDVPFLSVIHALGESHFEEAHSLLRRAATNSHVAADPEQLASHWVEVNILISSVDTPTVIHAFARLAYTCIHVGYHLTIDQCVNYFYQWTAASIPTDRTGYGSACFTYLLRIGMYFSEIISGHLDCSRVENLSDDVIPLSEITYTLRRLAEDRQPSTQWSTCIAHLAVDFALCLAFSHQADLIHESSDEDFIRFSCSLQQCADVSVQQTVQLLGGILLNLDDISQKHEKIRQTISSVLTSLSQSSSVQTT